MKKITQLLAFLFVATISYGQNLLLEGGFEGMPTGTPTTPWTTGQASGTTVNNNPAIARTGEQFLNLQNDFRNIRQAFTAEAGITYTLKFWNQFVGGQGLPESTDGIFVSIRQNTGGVNGTPFEPNIGFYIDPSAGDLNWTEFTLEFEAPQSDLLLYIFKQTRASGGPNNGTRMDDFSITENELSVQDLAQFGFTVYPNPVKDMLNLNAQAPIEKVEVFNLLGQQVLTTNLNKTSAQINVSNLTDGVYLMKTYINNVTGTYKFVKE
ncbi:T9SS type A sorting domain-containing protein [Paucihalobacter ruber]|uniref:T9SS type A sorting domain-containing protein n=1 Tax=Paucihalobacter ruber TaxID=2567861 RepID=A0A506PQP1_9FLAO|nr:T9SS type A sorting domain-containing protein [Paucihalobacter ruber]TPV35587.1 T9SS type A sorting domain-containing protein [Paucihalobacter ruber]